MWSRAIPSCLCLGFPDYRWSRWAAWIGSWLRWHPPSELVPSRGCWQAHGPLLGYLVLEFLAGRYTGSTSLLAALLGGLVHGQGLTYSLDTIGSEMCIVSLTSELQAGYFRQPTWMFQRHLRLIVSDTKLKISHSSGQFSFHIFHPYGLYQPVSYQVRYTRAVFTLLLCLISNQWPHLSLLTPNTSVPSTSSHCQHHCLRQATIISILVFWSSFLTYFSSSSSPLLVCPSCWGWSGVWKRPACSYPSPAQHVPMTSPWYWDRGP